MAAWNNPALQYALGNTDAEHDRLVRQAAVYDPLTERLFREAGIGPGQRVLDLGSGAGDVAILAARLVGASGEVVGVERNSQSIARAKARVAEAGLDNVSFIQSDVGQILRSKPFDAAIGRFILMFVPDPVSVVRSLSELVRSGGVIVFHEVSWAPVLQLYANLPLSLATASVILETLRRTGANSEMGIALYKLFQEAGLPAPTMRLEMPLGNNAKAARYISDIFRSMLPTIHEFNISTQRLGELETLQTRLQDEVAAPNAVAAWIALVGAWSTKP